MRNCQGDVQYRPVGELSHLTNECSVFFIKFASKTWKLILFIKVGLFGQWCLLKSCL